MGLKSFDFCPFCMKQVELHRCRDHIFLCPRCGCEFRHNLRRWLPMAIPFALAVVLMLYEFTHFNTVPSILIYVLLAIGVLANFLTPFPPYSITKPGRS